MATPQRSPTTALVLGQVTCWKREGWVLQAGLEEQSEKEFHRSRLHGDPAGGGAKIKEATSRSEASRDAGRLPKHLQEARLAPAGHGVTGRGV